MKAMAGRPEDVADTQALLRYLGLFNVDKVLDLIAKYVPAHLYGTHVRYFLEDTLEGLDP